MGDRVWVYMGDLRQEHTHAVRRFVLEMQEEAAVFRFCLHCKGRASNCVCRIVGLSERENTRICFGLCVRRLKLV